MAICGGVNYQLNKVSKQFLLYNIKDNKMKKMPDMLSIRYNFPMIYYDNKLYAFGGR